MKLLIEQCSTKEARDADRRTEFLLLVLSGLGEGIAFAKIHHVIAKGRIACKDGSNPGDSPLPLDGARVTMWDSDCAGSTICDDEMAGGYVNPDGTFQIEGDGADPWPGSSGHDKPDVYLRFEMNDDGHERGGPLTVYLDIAGLATELGRGVHGDALYLLYAHQLGRSVDKAIARNSWSAGWDPYRWKR